MTKEIPCESDRELETVKQTLDTLGVAYDVEYVVRARVPEGSNVMMINGGSDGDVEAVSDGGTGTPPSTVDADAPATDAADADLPAQMSLPKEGTKAYAVLREVATHDKEWVTLYDIAGNMSPDNRSNVGSHLSNLVRDGALKERESDQKAGNGQQLTAYKPREMVRRELAAHDPLNEVTGGE